jgi:hypothetical protein
VSVEAARGYSCTRQPARARQRRCNAQLPHLIPAQMYRENSPRLRFSAYSSLNVDTEK